MVKPASGEAHSSHRKWKRRAALRSPSLVFHYASPPAAATKRTLCEEGSYGKAGSTSVFSTCTDFNALGLTPSACRILGATCAVETRVFSTLDLNAGLETISPTFVSPYLTPPCSTFFA